jgi:3',5'-cyclic AMP phosphodiesterase CpdA
VILAHLSDLHLRDQDDAVEFARQLDCVVARGVDHLVITGDLLDRWNPALFEQTLDLIGTRGLVDRERLTIIHGNHDLASSGGHPRERSDLWRLVTRFWDPPPVIAARRHQFYRRITSRTAGVAARAPWLKTLNGGVRLAMLDSVPSTWSPLGLRRGTVILHHAVGAIAQRHIRWLSQQRDSTPLVVLMHHYPMPIGAFTWQLGRNMKIQPHSRLGEWIRTWRIEVPMQIDADDRAAFWDAARTAGVMAVICGHVHRARLERHDGIAIGLNGQSGAAWAGRTIAYYRIDPNQQSMESA